MTHLEDGLEVLHGHSDVPYIQRHDAVVLHGNCELHGVGFAQRNDSDALCVCGCERGRWCTTSEPPCASLAHPSGALCFKDISLTSLMTAFASHLRALRGVVRRCVNSSSSSSFASSSALRALYRPRTGPAQSRQAVATTRTQGQAPRFRAVTLATVAVYTGPAPAALERRRRTRQRRRGIETAAPRTRRAPPWSAPRCLRDTRASRVKTRVAMLPP